MSIESAINGTPGISAVRSASAAGISAVRMVFNWGVEPAKLIANSSRLPDLLFQIS